MQIAQLSRKLRNSRSAHLAIIVGVSGLIYALVFTIPFPLPRYYTTIPPVDYTKLTYYSPGGLVVYVAGITALFWLYFRAVRLTTPGAGEFSPASNDHQNSPANTAESLGPTPTPQPAISSRYVFLSSAILAAVSILAYPLTAIDLFIYAIRTRGWALYGLNPLATAPAELYAGDPWLGLAGEWIDAPSPYGPVWEWLSLAAFRLSGGNFLPHLLALKLVAVLFYLGGVWLVYRTLRQIQPRWKVAGTLAFAWSPLVLLESVQNGHNDMVMVFFLLAAVWVFEQMGRAESRRRWWLKCLLLCLFLALSILVKFVTVMVVPFFLLALAASQRSWPRRVAVMGLSGVMIGVLAAVPMLLLWPGGAEWAVLKAGSQAGRSLLALLILTFRDALGLNSAFDSGQYLIFALFSLIYLYFLGRTAVQVGRSLPPGAVATLPILPSFYALFWYVLLAAPVFHAWYLLWFLPLAPLLLPNRRPFIAGAVFSITALLIIPYFETFRVWYPALLQNQLIGHLIGVPLLIGPPALALIWPLDSGETGGI